MFFDLIKDYRCKICLEDYHERDSHKHGLYVCQDNRRCFGNRIIKKGIFYILQGKFYYSPHHMYMPMPYYGEIGRFKSLKAAKKAKENYIEMIGENVVG